MKRLLAALVVLGWVPARAAEFVPVFRLDALGGQHFFDGENTSFSGNGDLLFSPAVRFSDDDALVPTFSSQYRRTREVRELAGGGFLTQESLDTALTVKWLHRLSEEWSIKPSVGYKNELLAETAEERLGDGLFDYHKASVGVEWERKTDALSVRPALGVYGVRYYHYRTLSVSDPELGAEINSGDRVLDFEAYDLAVAADWLAREGTVLTGSFLQSFRPYRDQNIVTGSGAYESRKRRDLYLVAAAGVHQQLPEGTWWGAKFEHAAGLNLGWTHLLSNQSNYDASRTRFNPDYYDYYELSGGPFYAFRLAEKFAASLTYDFTRRRYFQRPVQDETGSYSPDSDAIFQNTHTVTCQFSYPVYGGLSATASGSYRAVLSNMRYESAYRYAYEAAHYFAGFSYAL